jgi:outer membrane protein TolC
LTTYYRSRIILSDERARLYQAQAWPVFSLFGIFQGRASGFDYNYGMLNPNAYSHGYWSGVDPNRSNYLIGLGMTWDLTSPLRIREQVSAQRWISRGLQDELGQIELELHNQLTLSDAKIRNALANFREAPVQLKAAGDAYAQKSVMYKNGLSNIVDVTQALFTLNRAETERDIASNNVWQALLIKTAALGDFDLFIQEQ